MNIEIDIVYHANIGGWVVSTRRGDDLIDYGFCTTIDEVCGRVFDLMVAHPPKREAPTLTG